MFFEIVLHNWLPIVIFIFICVAFGYILNKSQSNIPIDTDEQSTLDEINKKLDF